MVRDRYEVKGCLGIGRFGVVLQALDHEAGAEVALKVLDPSLIQDQETGARLLSGLRSLRSIKHPAMARIHDANCEGAHYFLTRQLLDGTPLSRLLAGRRKRGRVFTLREAYPVIAQVADLLSGGLVHGGLCPDDIWILPDQLKVTDVGLAELLAPDRVATLFNRVPRYKGFLAPEIARGSRPDSRSDVYALGALLGELLTLIQADGHVPAFHQQDRDLPVELTELIERAMQQRPDRRFAEPAAFVRSLNEVIGNATPQALRNDTIVDHPPVHDTKSSPPPVELLEDVLIGASTRPTPEAPDITAQVVMEEIIVEHAARQKLDEARRRPASAPPIRPERPTRQSAAARAARRSIPPPLPPAASRKSPVAIAKVIIATNDEGKARLRDDGTARIGSKRPRPSPPHGVSAADRDPSPDNEALRDVTEEIDIDMLQPVAPPQAGAAASKLESEVRVAKRKTTEELLRRSNQLEGIDPRLVRAAHAIESEKVSSASAQAAAILRQRAEREDLEGIDPRLLRAAARLESARISSIPSPAPTETEDPDSWRDEIAQLQQDQVISFLSPPLSTKHKEVTGFPRNQQRGPATHVPAEPRAPRPSETPPPLPKKK